MATMSFTLDEIDNIVSGQSETWLCLVREVGTRVIFPLIDEDDGIIEHYYNTFCGKRGRVSMSFEGIPRESIEQQIATESMPDVLLFSNEKKLKPVVSLIVNNHLLIVNNHHQMDLVEFTRYPQLRSGKTYT